ncbi:MAG: type I restriction endonuclease [Candidatus Latescibacterota bacterium]
MHGWGSIYAYKNEDFGPVSLLGRSSDRDVALTRSLRAKLVELNPGLPDEAYDDAVRQIVTTSAMQSLAATNREKYTLLRDGVQVTFHNDKGERERQRLRVFDFVHPENNHFLCVRELWVRSGYGNAVQGCMRKDELHGPGGELHRLTIRPGSRRRFWRVITSSWVSTGLLRQCESWNKYMPPPV